MSLLIAVVGATDRPTQAMLAAAALKKAAATRGRPLAVELQSGGTVTGALEPEMIASAETVLLIGDVTGDGRFAGKQTVHVTLDAVLTDPGAVLSGAAAPAPAASAASGPRKVVAITSCPTGIAHTFMAAEGIEQGAKALGHAISVETQGSVGAQNTLTADEIAAADVVMIAADTNVDLARFAGKRSLFDQHQGRHRRRQGPGRPRLRGGQRSTGRLPPSPPISPTRWPPRSPPAPPSAPASTST